MAESCFMIKQPFFSPKFSRITNQASITSNHPMAGYNDRHLVFSVSRTSRPNRFCISQSFTEFMITDGFTKGDSFKFVPYFLLKFRASLADGEIKHLPCAKEIFIQLPFARVYYFISLIRYGIRFGCK